MNFKKLNKFFINAGSSALEKEIDQRVYELYDLTEEEIRLIKSLLATYHLTKKNNSKTNQ